VIGDGVRIGHGAAISASAFVEMNDRSVAGPFLTVLDDSYHHESGRARPRPVHIGRDVVLGANVTVLPGASIGDGARVLAGSTVSGQVAAGATVSGIPAQAR
jgi:maltose O-acetyltransferase